jgi:hypothetical protein
VPVDVAVEEPRAGVIGKEANCHNIPSVTHTHNIPDNGVIKIVRRVTSATDHVEVVPVQMNRMLLREVIAINFDDVLPQFENPHRCTNDPRRNGQLNTLAKIETVNAASGD